eukprot:4732993-Amphidinium_carterae.1
MRSSDVGNSMFKVISISAFGSRDSSVQQFPMGLDDTVAIHTFVGAELATDCKGVAKALQAIQSGLRQSKGRHRDLKCELGMPFLMLASSTGSKPIRPAKRSMMGGSPLRTSKATRKPMWWPTLDLLFMLTTSRRLNTSVGRWWPMRSDSFGFWLDQSSFAGTGRGGRGSPGLQAEPLPQAPREVCHHNRVVEYDVFARCLFCHWQTGL